MHLKKKLNQGDLSVGTFVWNLIGMLCAVLSRTRARWQRVTICHSVIHSTRDKGLQTDVRPPHIPVHCAAFLLSISFVPPCLVLSHADTPKHLTQWKQKKNGKPELRQLRLHWFFFTHLNICWYFISLHASEQSKVWLVTEYWFAFL